MKRIPSCFTMLTSSLLLVTTLQAQPPAKPSRPEMYDSKHEAQMIRQQAEALQNTVRQLEQALIAKNEQEVENAERMILVKMNEVIEQEKRRVERMRSEEHRTSINSPAPSGQPKTTNEESKVDNEEIERMTTTGDERIHPAQMEPPQWQKRAELLSQQRRLYNEFKESSQEHSDSTSQHWDKSISIVDRFTQNLQEQVKALDSTAKKETEKGRKHTAEQDRKLPLPEKIEDQNNKHD